MKKNRMQQPGNAFQAEKVPLRECLSIFRGVKMPVGLMALAMLLSIVSAVVALKTISFSGTAVDAAGNVPVKDMVVYVVAAISAAGLTIASNISVGFAGQNINFKLRGKLWDKIMSLHAKSFEADGGETLVTRVTADCEFASDFFSTTVNIVMKVISSVMYIVTLYSLNVRMANYMLVYIPVSILLGGIFTVLAFLTRQKLQARLAGLAGYVIERLRDIPQIKTNNTQDVETENAGAFLDEYYRASIASRIAQGVSGLITMFLDILSIAIPFGLGASAVARGEMSIGEVVIFNTMFGNVKGFFTQMITYAGQYKTANGALARVTRLLKVEDENVFQGEALEPGKVEDIVISSVDFSYTEDRKILRKLECVIPKNKVTAVLGTNGSGKSTLFKLICRLYEPDGGSVLFGSKDAKDFSLNSWRKKICLIQQDSPMMSGTIRDNILYGCEEGLSDEKLLEIAKAAHVWDFVQNFPEGFDTHVEPGAANFSGGQKQCIAIARAMATNSEYLLLDEATSSLDVKREKDVMEALDNAMKGRTTIIIAHSITTIRKADQVIVLKDGGIDQIGTREEILARTGSYLSRMMERGRPRGTVAG